MDKGFIFETKNRFYFIPTNNEKKSKKMAQNFVDFFASRFNGQITDEMLSEKFDTFTDWYNSDILEKSMDLLGNVVNQIKG